MSSTYTAALRLLLQGTGDNQNTWGGALNTGVFQLIEDALTGVAMVDLAVGTVTLSVQNGATDQARKSTLWLTGALSADRSVVIPSVPKIYLVYNGTSNARAVNIQTVSGVAVQPKQGWLELVWCDGTDCHLLSVQQAANATNAAQLGGIDASAYATDSELATAISNLSISLTSSFNAALSAVATPPGVMAEFGGTSAPTGWLLCQGQQVSRTTYAALFSAIGTTWGAGDGATTFTLPDTRRRVGVGSGGNGSGTLGASPGNVGGSETITLTGDQVGQLSITVTADDGDSQGGGLQSMREMTINGVSVTTNGAGSAIVKPNSQTPTSIMQPSYVVTKIIKT